MIGRTGRRDAPSRAQLCQCCASLCPDAAVGVRPGLLSAAREFLLFRGSSFLVFLMRGPETAAGFSAFKVGSLGNILCKD